MKRERLEEITTRFSNQRIAVIGDFFLDKYLDVDPSLAEVSVETGRTAHQVARIRHSPGAAGTVVRNLAALGAGKLYALGFIGEDGEGFDLRRDLEALGCSTKGLLEIPDRATPTYLKPRNLQVPGLEGEHDRYDTKNRTATPHQVIDRLATLLGDLLPHLDAVVIQDQVPEQECGVVTAGFRASLADMAAAMPQLIFWADSRIRIRSFRNVTIKPNQFEALGVENPTPEDKTDDRELQEAVRNLRREVNGPVFATRGSKGILVSDPEPTSVRGVKVSGPLDITGAGDSVTAGAVLALTSGGTHPEAALIGNLVASVTIQQLGTTGTATVAELFDRLDLWQRQKTC